jgi:activator of 2-hydroxyglutaryl-CoA dehydratase
MCEVSTVLLVASLVTTAATGAYMADNAKKQGQYQAEIAEQNAELTEFKAQQAATIGSVQEERARRQAQQRIGQQRAALAANGVDLGSGTAVDLVSETALFGEEDALTTRFNAMNDAWSMRAQAVDYRNQGRAAKVRGKNEATGTYLTTAANMASTGYGAARG